MNITQSAIEKALEGGEDIKNVAIEALTALYKVQIAIYDGQKGSYPSEVVYPTVMKIIRAALDKIDTTVGVSDRHQDNTKPVPYSAPRFRDSCEYKDSLLANSAINPQQ